MPLAVKFTDVSRYFGDVRAVDAVNFDVQTGEFFSLLGPSGSGKTTCLRMLAGFEHPTSGRIELYGRDVTSLPPYEREVNTVFQNYALFPHMSVGDNIGYGLMVKGVNKNDRADRVAEMLALVHLPGMEKRKPSQLSGGQQQRVALARALINRPRVLLLDEPLGALDLKLRQQMQIELKAIQREVGITFLFVTHDQEEALTMSNRIAVFNRGQIEQIGTPAELYEHPATPFVATFVGVSNMLSADQAAIITGVERAVSVRPEKIHFAELTAPVPAGHCSTTGTIGEILYLGMYTRYSVNLDGGGELLVVEQNRTVTSKDVLAAEGRRVQLLWPAAANNPL